MVEQSSTQTPRISHTQAEASASSAPGAKILLFTTGGTIASTADATGALVPTLSGKQLADALRPQLKEVSITVVVRELASLDSSSMTLADIDMIISSVHDALADPSFSGFVITHGTDSLEETALALDLFHDDPRPVVLTGAQLPYDHPHSDGLDNLREAILIAADPVARSIGVLVVFHHAVLPARGVTKWHTSDLLAFATTSPEEPTRPEALPLVPLRDHRVDIIAAYPGAPRSLIDFSLANGARGLVIQGMGSGNVGTSIAEGITDALRADIPVVITTRVPRGWVSGVYGGCGGGATLAHSGAIGSTYFRAPQARIILIAALATGVHPATLF